MRTLMRGRFITVVMAIGMVIVSITGCGGEPDNAVTISYTLPIAPITFSFDTDGHISVSVSAEIVTELGELQVSAGSAITPFATSAPDNVLILTIRHKEDGNLVDTGYQIDTTGVGSADVQGDISEVHIGWNGKSNSIFIDASQGNITQIVIQGAASETDSTVPTTAPPTTAPPATFQCPDSNQVSAWMNANVSKVTNDDPCAFHAGDIQGQTLRGVVCTTEAGGTTIEYTPVDEPKTLVVTACTGEELSEMYGFTVRFIQGYPPSGPYSASVCAVAQAARDRRGSDPLPADWTVQANC